ncbi:patatin-like phospholipase family protein [Weeksellaceae bacterium TAE3-ERU29]|nr:patatin-like phospholipase family protein [Weeksellaceae bacterium TAE3-ERU29]
MIPQKPKYKNAIIFSGGGTRFALYCGMYEACEEMGIKPDLIISACGGTIASAVINSFSTHKERKEYLQSNEFYQFILSLKLTHERYLHRIGWLCIKKMLSSKKAPYIEDIFNRYLVDIPMDISTGLPSLAREFSPSVPTIIVGSKLLFDKAETGNFRHNRKLYQKVLFTDEQTAKSIDENSIKIHSENYKTSAVDDKITVKTDIPLLIATRISVSDMFYMSPVFWQNHYYAGGAIDLLPAELALSLAENIIYEKKQNYTRLEEALVRAVLGFSGNARWEEIEKILPKKYAVNTTDASTFFKGHYVSKKIDLKRFGIKLEKPFSFQKFVKDIDFQWQYGYNRTLEMLKKERK